MLQLVLLLACPFTPAQKDAFIVCYDTENQRPFWTAHRFTPGHPAAPRKHWRKDHELNSLPSAAFTNSGFDRGHLVAAADAPESNDTFLTSNAVAQNRQLNRGEWRQIENRIRRANQPAVIITGAFDWSCGNEKIEAPCYLFKLARFADSAILIAVLPNAPPNANTSPTRHAIQRRDRKGAHLPQPITPTLNRTAHPQQTQSPRQPVPF